MKLIFTTRNRSNIIAKKCEICSLEWKKNETIDFYF